MSTADSRHTVDEEDRFAAETSDPSSRCQVPRTTPSIHTYISTSTSRISHQPRPSRVNTASDASSRNCTQCVFELLKASPRCILDDRWIPHKHACIGCALFLLLRQPMQGGVASLRRRRARIASSIPTIVRRSMQAEHSITILRATANPWRSREQDAALLKSASVNRRRTPMVVPAPTSNTRHTIPWRTLNITIPAPLV